MELSSSGFPYAGFDFLFNDFETASKLDVSEVGTSRYVSDPSTRPLMNSWVLNRDSEIKLWEPDIQVIPSLLQKSLLDPHVIKVAFNVAFERGIWKHKFGIDIPIEQWFDVKVLARYMSFPGPLKKVCSYMDLPVEFQKFSEEGEKYIRMFSAPAREGGRVTLWGIEEDFYNSRDNKPEEWIDFGKYCKQDTNTERYIFYSGIKTFLNTHEIRAWHLDQKINQRGLPVNVEFVENALKMAIRSIDELRQILINLTGLDNPNADQKMLEWLTGQGYNYTSLNKDVVKVALANPKMTPLAQEVLLIRAEFKRSSYKKLEALLQRINDDSRIRDCFAFMGGARTGRWAGQDVQFQNLARPDKKVEENLVQALYLIETCDYETACKEFGITIKWCGKERYIPTAVGMVISCLRSIFQARKGNILVVCDLSAIENRVLGWLAGCAEILDVFRNKLDAYKAFATMMYMVAYDKVTKEMRTVAKPAVLGCGYGLGPGVVKKVDQFTGEVTYTIQWKCSHCHKVFEDKEHRCFDDKGNPKGDLAKNGLMGYAEKMSVYLTGEQAYKAWETFHKYKEIPKLWSDLEKAAIKVIRKGGKVRVNFVEFSRVKRKNGQIVLRIQLPSGRYLHYINARIETTVERAKKGNREYEKHTIFYDGIGHGVGATSKAVKWGPVKTYGGKLCLSGHTQVLTERGVISLTSVLPSDKLWDGLEWVSHKGLISNGVQETQEWMGLETTANHQILAGNEWRELGKMDNLSGVCSLLRGVASAIQMLFSLNPEKMGGLECDATADKSSMCTQEHCGGVMLISARSVAVEQEAKEKQRNLVTMSSSTQSYGRCGFANCQESYPGATTPSALHTLTMEGEESLATSLGEETAASGWNTPLHCQNGLIQLSNLIESIMMEITNRETFDLFLVQRIQTIEEQLVGLLGEVKNIHIKNFIRVLFPNGVETIFSTILTEAVRLNGVWKDTKRQEVFDLLDCGHRHRFTVLTDACPVIVHNCENVVQAISRDILLHGMTLADEIGMTIVGHVHDEIICEEPDVFGRATINDLQYCMSAVPDWAPGLPLGAEGYESTFYKKG